MGAAHPFGIGLAEGWGVGWGQWRGRGSAFRGGDRAPRGCLMAPGVRAHLWLRDAVLTNGITRRWSRPLAALARSAPGYPVVRLGLASLSAHGESAPGRFMVGLR